MSDIKLRTGITAGVAAGLAIFASIVVAGVALLPSWTGVVVARTLDSAGYEIRQKADQKEEKKAEKPIKPSPSQSKESKVESTKTESA